MTSVVPTTERLPLSLDEITPQWLSGALARSFPGVEVASTRRDREFFGTAASARLHLTYAPGSPAGPASVHVKGGFDDTWRRRVWVTLQQEVSFYNEVAPEIDLNIPRVYFAEMDDSPQGLIVLEDLAARGVAFGQNFLPVTPDHAASVLEQLARMHAAWWDSPELGRFEGWEVAQRKYLKHCFRPSHWEVLVEWANGDLLREAIGSSANAVTVLEQLWDWCDSQPRTFLHGDPHGGNFYYEPDGRPGILDWQLCFAGNYSHDMAWVIVTTLDVEQRRANERDLVETYRDALVAAGPSAPASEDMWSAYRRQMAHAIASYGAMPRDNGPAAVMEEAGKRVFTAAIDHDVLGVYGLKQ